MLKFRCYIELHLKARSQVEYWRTVQEKHLSSAEGIFTSDESDEFFRSKIRGVPDWDFVLGSKADLKICAVTITEENDYTKVVLLDREGDLHVAGVCRLLTDFLYRFENQGTIGFCWASTNVQAPYVIGGGAAVVTRKGYRIRHVHSLLDEMLEATNLNGSRETVNIAP